MGEYVRDANPAVYKVDPSATPSIPDGSFVKWDATNLRVDLQATGSATGCVGVCEGQIPIASNIDNATGLENRLKVRSEGVFRFKTTATESYKHGLTVGVGADSQTVKLDATAANIVGRVWLPEGETVTGAAGVTVTVKILPQYVV